MKRANRLKSERWRANCQNFNYKSGGCTERKICNPYTCLEYIE